MIKKGIYKNSSSVDYKEKNCPVLFTHMGNIHFQFDRYGLSLPYGKSEAPETITVKYIGEIGTKDFNICLK